MLWALAFLFAIEAVAQPVPVPRTSVELRLAAVGAKTDFRIGEAIPISLDFQYAGSETLRVLTDVRIRTIRPQQPDEFSAASLDGSTDGWADPLGDLHWLAEGGFSGSGPKSAPLDSLHPIHVERDLNEFIVFRKPGRYRVTVRTSRVFVYPQAPRYVPPPPINATTIELTILPRDDAQSARQFETAKAILDPWASGPAAFQGEASAFIQAIRTLRYLDTEPAARYLAAIYDGGGGIGGRELEYALYSFSYREAMIEELEKRIVAPDMTINQGVLSAPVELKGFLLERKKGEPLSQAEWEGLDDSVNRIVFEAAPRKLPEAKVTAYLSLYEIGSKSYRGNSEVLRRLIESLPGGPAYALPAILTQLWDQLGNARTQLVPLLKRVVSGSSLVEPRIAGIALLRLSEIEPQAAKDAALHDLMSGELLMDDDHLIDFSLPESDAIDQALLLQYRQGKKVETRIAKFASSKIEEDVWRTYGSRSPRDYQGCATSPLFAYFFRVNATAAAIRLADDRNTGGNGCYPRISRSLVTPALEQQLIADAQSPLPHIRDIAIDTLGYVGPSATLPVLLGLLDQAAEPKSKVILSIMNGRRWILKDADYATLLKNCSGTDLCPEIARVRREFQPPFSLGPFDHYDGRYEVLVAHHQFVATSDLDEILAQMPAGASFRWEGHPSPLIPRERAMYDQVLALLAKYRMTLVN